MPIKVKICGLRTPQAVAAAVEGGAAYTGFVFFPPSPRSLTPSQAAQLTALVPDTITSVGLFVDASDEWIDEVLSATPLDLLQLHGSETPQRVKEIKERTALPVLKMIPVSKAEDLNAVQRYETSADLLLFDAKPPKGATRPGGNALAFDWQLIKEQSISLPWMLAGGLNENNIQEAIKTSGAKIIDVSSGVEDELGQKNIDKIKAFLKKAQEI